MARRLPIPESVRPRWRALRIFSVLALLFGLWLGWVLLANDVTPLAFLVASLGLGFALAAWIGPYYRWMWLAMLAPMVVFVVVDLPDLSPPGVVLLVGLVVVILTVLIPRRVPLDPESIRAVGTNDVMRYARPSVETLEASGWEHVGGIEFHVGKVRAVAAVMLDPHDSAYASITDVNMEIASLFAGGRSLLTRNSANVTLGLDILTNDIWGADIHELVAAHEEALGILAALGARPLAIDPVHLIGLAIAREKAVLEALGPHLRTPPPWRSSKGAGLLSAPSAEPRLRTWLETTT